MVVWLAPDIPEIVPRLIGSLEHRAWDYCFRHFLQTVALKGSRARPHHEIQTTILPQERLSQSCRALPRPRLGPWNSRRFSLRSLAGSYATPPVSDKRKAFCVAETNAYPASPGDCGFEPSPVSKPRLMDLLRALDRQTLRKKPHKIAIICVGWASLRVTRKAGKMRDAPHNNDPKKFGLHSSRSKDLPKPSCRRT